MKQEALFKKLGYILNELNEQYEFLSQNPAQLSELELELFLANASFLTDHIQIIKKLNLPQHSPLTGIQEVKDPIVDEEISDELKDVQQVEAITFANVAQEEELIAPPTSIPERENIETPILKIETPEVEEVEKEIFRLDSEPSQTFEFILNKDAFNEDDKFDYEEKTTEQLFDRPLSKEEALILEQKKKVKEKLVRNPEELEEDEVGPEPFLVQHQAEPEEIKPPVIEPLMKEQPAPVLEKKKVVVETAQVEVETSAYKPTLNDLLAGKNVSTRVNEASGAVVSDLKAAINLNDKLLYIKDLFNGYNLAYAEAIDIANKMPNFDAADNFFQKNYAVKNNWADKQATVDKFYLLLNKRFRD